MNDITFQRKLISIMKDNMFDRFVANKKSGKLNTKKLYKIDSSNKLFKKKEERKGKHYNITVLVDCSGSMSRGRSVYAGNATEMLAKNFEKSQLHFQIYGFNADLIKLKSFNQKLDKNLAQFIKNEIPNLARNNKGKVSKKLSGELYSPNFHSKDYSKVSAKIDYSITAGNFDGFWINHIVKEVSQMKGKNILIVLSDGAPSHDYGDFIVPNTNRKKKYYEHYDLKKVVKSAIDKGIVFLGIGINTTSVQSYYPPKNTIVCQNLNNLYEDIVKKLDGLIKRG